MTDHPQKQGEPMEAPSVVSKIVDRQAGTVYRVLAYRRLTDEELVISVRHFRASKQGRKVKPGSEVTIVSIIGHDE